MPSPSPTLESRRQETLDQLESLLAAHRIGADEYRRLAEVARNAADETELLAASPDALQVPTVRHSAPARAPAPLPPEQETGFVFACMGGSIRKGPWEPPDRLYAFSMMGGVDLDFREAALLDGVTEVRVLAFMGGVKITVPDDIDVEVNGVGFMGGFEHVSKHHPGEGRPLLRISGLAFMGGVAVKVKPPPGQSTVERIARRVRNLV